jgi:hypothetical protein
MKEMKIIKSGDATYLGISGTLYIFDEFLYFEEFEDSELNHKIPLNIIDSVETTPLLSSIILNIEDEKILYEVNSKEEWKKDIDRQLATPLKISKTIKSIEKGKTKMNNENQMNTMYCQNCGNQISKEAYVCPKCGVLTNGKKNINDADAPNGGLNAIGFLIPIIGLILFLAFVGTSPKKANSILFWSFFGFVLSLILITSLSV